ncbi:DJ-1/PfpI family protein [Zopfochytrium polystomum]|nr:DJ-1/PfpI family protein [Zopfochytrium polystomum]
MMGLDSHSGNGHDVLVVLFDGFAPMDVFGPVQFFASGLLKWRIKTATLEGGTATSSSGQPIIVDFALKDLAAKGEKLDFILVPGGFGTRRLVESEEFLAVLRTVAGLANEVWSVCTGSALLAKAGLLDGRKATGNKLNWEWNTSQGPNVDWVHQARWVHDGTFWTSSGVAAGCDMACAIIKEHCSPQLAEQVAIFLEYEPHLDSSWDPFSVVHKRKE